MKVFLTIILTLSLFLLVTCEDNPECASCGGNLLDGFFQGSNPGRLGQYW